MQIFTFFDVNGRGETPRQKAAAIARVDSRLCVIPATAGLDHTCHYMLLPSGNRCAVSPLAHSQWWACLQGGVRVLDGNDEVAVLASGDIFSGDIPGRQPSGPMEMQAVIDSVLVCATALPHRPFRGGAGMGEFLAIEPGEPDWAQRLLARGLVWAICHHGTFCLQWRDARPLADLHTTYLQPGMAFAPAPGDDYCIDAMLPGAGLLCCVRPAPAPEAGAAALALPRWHEAAA